MVDVTFMLCVAQPAANKTKKNAAIRFLMQRWSGEAGNRQPAAGNKNVNYANVGITASRNRTPSRSFADTIASVASIGHAIPISGSFQMIVRSDFGA